MEQYFLIWLGILIIGTIIGYIIMKNVIKTLVTFLFIIFLFAAITVTLTYSDIQELREAIAEKEIVVIVQENEEPVFAAVIANMGNEPQLKELSLSEAELQESVQKKDWKAVQEGGEYDKVLSMSSTVFEGLDEQLPSQEKTKSELLNDMKNKELIFEERAGAYMVLEAALVEQEGIFYFLEEYKKGTIEVYPKSIFFQLLKVFPTKIINGSAFVSSSEE